AEKRLLLERAEALENLLTQMGAPFGRLDLAGFRTIVHAMINPGRPAPAPADDGDSLLREGLAFTHGELEDASLRLNDLRHRVLSVREVPRETWAGMLPLEALLEGSIVFNIEVCPGDQIRK